MNNNIASHQQSDNDSNPILQQIGPEQPPLSAPRLPQQQSQQQPQYQPQYQPQQQPQQLPILPLSAPQSSAPRLPQQQPQQQSQQLVLQDEIRKTQQPVLQPQPSMSLKRLRATSLEADKMLPPQLNQQSNTLVSLPLLNISIPKDYYIEKGLPTPHQFNLMNEDSELVRHHTPLEMISVKKEKVISDIENAYDDLLVPVHLQYARQTYYWCPFCRCIFSKNAANRKHKGNIKGHRDAAHKIIHNSIIFKYRLFLHRCGLIYYRFIQEQVLAYLENRDKGKRNTSTVGDINEYYTLRDIPEGFKSKIIDDEELEQAISNEIASRIIRGYVSNELGDYEQQQPEVEVETYETGNVTHNSNRTPSIYQEDEDIQRYIGSYIKTDDSVEPELLAEQLANLMCTSKEGFDDVCSYFNDHVEEKDVSPLFNLIGSEIIGAIRISKPQDHRIVLLIKLLFHLVKVDNFKISLEYDNIRKRWLKMNEISVKRVKEVHNKCQSFSLAADETSDKYVSTMCIYARFLIDRYYWDQLITLETLEKSCTSENLIELVLNIFKKYNFDYNKFSGITTDGARNMMGCKKGLSIVLCKLIKDARIPTCSNKICNYIDCMDHRLNLVGRAMEKKEELKEVFTFVNFFKQGPVIDCYVKYIMHKNVNKCPLPSNTRWCYDPDIINYIVVNYTIVVQFMTTVPDISDDFNKYFEDSIINKRFAHGCDMFSDIIFESTLRGINCLLNDTKGVIMILENKYIYSFQMHTFWYLNI